MHDLNGIRSKFDPLLDYYEHMRLIKRQSVDAPVVMGTVKITLVPVPKNKSVSVFVFESRGKKLVYVPCDCVPFPTDEILRGMDILVIGNTVISDVLKNGRKLSSEHPLRKEPHSFEGVLGIRERLGIGCVVITHIEEDWGKTYDDYVALEKQHVNVQFALGGLTIEL